MKIGEAINKICLFVRADLFLTFFIYNIYKNKVTTNIDNKTIFLVIVEWLKSFKTFNSKAICMNRNLEESLSLLEALVEEYSKTESNKVLEQILQVLKTEFIKRK